MQQDSVLNQTLGQSSYAIDKHVKRQQPAGGPSRLMDISKGAEMFDNSIMPANDTSLVNETLDAELNALNGG